MKEIPLTQGMVALVDDDDYLRLIKYKWCAHKNQNRFYAERRVSQKTVRMHREILVEIPPGMFPDHIDGNGLNNQKSNLRIITHRGNCQNKHTKKSSRFPGVWWSKICQKWVSSIWVGKKRVNLGCFENEDGAYKAYREACNSPDNITVFRKLTTSKYPGVYWNKNSKKWAVQIHRENQRTRPIYLGTYDDEIEAATVFQVARAVLIEQAVAKKGATS